MNKNLHEGHRDRLRSIVEKIKLENMPEHQALEFLLTFVIPRKDTNPIAHKLINKFGSLSGVLDANKNELLSVKGIGETGAFFLSNLTNIFSCYKISKGKSRPVFHTTHEVYLYIKPFLEYKTSEELYLICIDNRNNLVCMDCISKGVFNSSSIDMQKLISALLCSKCCNFILVHNHPNGNASPSFDDDKFTRGVMLSSVINGFKFLDHIIIGNDTYFSYSKSGMLDKYKYETINIVENKSANIIVGKQTLKQHIYDKKCDFNRKI